MALLLPILRELNNNVDEIVKIINRTEENHRKNLFEFLNRWKLHMEHRLPRLGDHFFFSFLQSAQNNIDYKIKTEIRVINYWTIFKLSATERFTEKKLKGQFI
jgi:hypothetical protein